MYGDTADGSWFFDLIKQKKDVSDLRDTLIFGLPMPGGFGKPFGSRCSLAA